MGAQFVMTPRLALRLVVACAFGVLSVYLLSTGRRDKDVEKLIWAAVCGLLTAVAFML